MAYTLEFTDTSKTPITVVPLATDNTSTDLTFVGRGVPNYGESQQTNFLHLLENFASANEPAHPVIGMIWYDPSEEQLKVCLDFESGTGAPIWTTISEMAITAGLVEPTLKKTGMLWYDFNVQKLKVWNGSKWVIVGADATTLSSTAPSQPVIGQLWYDLSTSLFKVWDGSQWREITSSDTSISTTQPLNPVIGSLWFDLTDKALKIYTGLATGWRLSARSAAIVANAEPTAMQDGELWYDTANSQIKAWYNNQWNATSQAMDEGIKWLGLLAM